MIDIIASGLIVGAAYASLGIGLTLVSKMSGVVSFAQTAIALLGCYTGMSAAQAWSLPPALALTVGVAVGGLIGSAFGAVISVWFQGADVRIKSSVTIALMIGALTVGARAFGDIPREAPNLFAGQVVSFGDVQIEVGLVMALIFAVCLAIVLDLFIHRTHAGTRLQAFAERPVTAELIGIPALKLTVAVWGVSGAISALSLSIVMASSARSANFMSMSLLIIPALCASLIGRFQSFYLTLLGGLGLGTLEAGIQAMPSVAPYAQAAYLPVVMLVLFWVTRKEVWDGQRA
jgi:branched-chain amino acid transport system permease protein